MRLRRRAATSRRSLRQRDRPGGGGGDLGRTGGRPRVARRVAGRGLDARDVAEAEDEAIGTAGEIMDRARRAFAEACVDARRRVQPGADRRRRQRRPEPGRAMAGSRSRTRRGGRVPVPRARVEIVPAELGDDVGLVGAPARCRGCRCGRAEARIRAPPLGGARRLQREVRTQPPILKTLPPQIGQVP